MYWCLQVRYGFSNKPKIDSSPTNSSLLLTSNPNNAESVSSVVLEKNLQSTSKVVQQQNLSAYDVKSIRVSKFKASRLSLNSKEIFVPSYWYKQIMLSEYRKRLIIISVDNNYLELNFFPVKGFQDICVCLLYLPAFRHSVIICCA